MQSAIHYPSIKNLLLKCVPKHYMDIHAEHEAFTHERISKRVELGKQRNDLIEGLLMKQDELVSSPASRNGFQAQRVPKLTSLFSATTPERRRVPRRPPHRRGLGDDGDAPLRRHLPAAQEPRDARAANARGAVNLQVGPGDQHFVRGPADLHDRLPGRVASDVPTGAYWSAADRG